MVSPPSHRTRGCCELPVDRQRLIHLHILAGLHTSPTQNALVRIVAIEGIAEVGRIGLGLIRALLMFHVEQSRGVMHSAVFIVVITDRAIQHVIAQDAIEGFALGHIDQLRLCHHDHAIGNRRSAGTGQVSVHLHHAGIARLNRTELRVITNLGNDPVNSIENVDQRLTNHGHLGDAINLKSARTGGRLSADLKIQGMSVHRG